MLLSVISKLLYSIIIILPLFLVATQHAYASAEGIFGYVKNSRTGQGLANVGLKWTDAPNAIRYTFTDSNGRFEFPSWQEQNVRITACNTFADYYGNGGNIRQIDWSQWHNIDNVELYGVGTPSCSDGNGGGFDESHDFGCNEDLHRVDVLQPNSMPAGGTWSATYAPVGDSWVDSGVTASGQGIANLHIRNIYENLRYVGEFDWSPPQISIRGRVVNAANCPNANQGIPGVQMVVLKGDGSTQFPTTDSNGYFNQSNFVYYSDVYRSAVQTVPNGYDSTTVKTTTSGWDWDYCVNPNIGTNPWGDVPPGSLYYNCQKAGLDDCATDQNGSTNGRCNFSICGNVTPPPNTPIPTIRPQPTPTATATGCGTCIVDSAQPAGTTNASQCTGNQYLFGATNSGHCSISCVACPAGTVPNGTRCGCQVVAPTGCYNTLMCPDGYTCPITIP